MDIRSLLNDGDHVPSQSPSSQRARPEVDNVEDRQAIERSLREMAARGARNLLRHEPDTRKDSVVSSYSSRSESSAKSIEGGAVALPKSLPCYHCHKLFTRRSDLVRHERIHSGVRPHSCTYPGCGKSFIQRSALTIHERVHTGDKPHECQQCGKPFSDSSSLARHRRTHTGVRPYRCLFPGCGKDFTRKTTLSRHRHNHTAKGHVPAKVTKAASVSTVSTAPSYDDLHTPRTLSLGSSPDLQRERQNSCFITFQVAHSEGAERCKPLPQYGNQRARDQPQPLYLPIACHDSQRQQLPHNHHDSSFRPPLPTAPPMYHHRTTGRQEDYFSRPRTSYHQQPQEQQQQPSIHTTSYVGSPLPPIIPRWGDDQRPYTTMEPYHAARRERRDSVVGRLGWSPVCSN